jgi:diguanylate cyclase (GGDEF)-like protein/PAS domain S-box-containing protein
MLAPSPEAPLIHLSSDFIRAKEYLEAIVTSTSDAICTTDTEGRILYFSPGAEAMTGARSADMVGKPAHSLYAGGKEEGRRIMALLRKTGALHNFETLLKAKDGRRIHVSMSASLMRDRAGNVIGTLGISKDISTRVELEQRLRELTITDSLTGLYNQRHFQERLAQEASRARRQRNKLALILIDLDGFKALNDREGHLAGDAALRCFANAILSSIRKETDSAFRYGGDEFVLLLPEMALTSAERVISRLTARAERCVGGKGVGFSYGMSALGPTGSLSDFLRRADRQMFKMKAARKKARAASSRPPNRL